MSSTGSYEQRERTRFFRERSNYDDGGSRETGSHKLRYGAGAGGRASPQAAHRVRERRHGRDRLRGVPAPGAKRRESRGGVSARLRKEGRMAREDAQRRP